MGLELRVDFQIDHTRTPLSLLLRRFFLLEKGRNILLCGFQLEQFFLGFLVLFVELCLEIGCCRPVRCQFCAVLLLKGSRAIFLYSYK